MPRPALPPDQKREPFKARLNASERAALHRLATRWGCSMNEAINRAVSLAESNE